MYAPSSRQMPCTNAEASDAAGVESFVLTPEQLNGGEITLRPVKFNRVNTLSIFVESNQDDEDTTIIQKVAVLGVAGEGMNVAEIKDPSKEEGK